MTTAAITVQPHLTFGGDCEEAFTFYQRIFGGSLRIVRYGDSPMADTVPVEWRSKVAHATLTSDALMLAGADLTTYVPPRGFFALLEIGDPVRGRAVFDALAAGGEVGMAFQETFWSPGFGVLVDRFGIPWEVNCAAR
jgi:PhnB protein